jgi:hypothetical protein
LFIGRGILRRWRHGARIIRTLRMGEDARGSIATGGEVPARDEPSDLRRRKVGKVVARRGRGLFIPRGWA